MVKRIAACAFLFAIGCGGTARVEPALPANESAAPVPAAKPERSPEESIAGTYRTSHAIMVVCDNPDWCEETVDDVLTIVPSSSPGQIHVAIDLVQTNGHTCGFEGAMTRAAEEPSGRWEFRAPTGEDPCLLTLEDVAGESLRLRAEGCRYYCGARASLDADFSDAPVP